MRDSRIGTSFVNPLTDIHQIHKIPVMKKYLLITLLTPFILMSCNKGKIQDLEKRNSELTSQSQLQDSLLNEFMTSFNEFESNLEKIKEKEDLIAMTSEDPEMRKDGKEKILGDIDMINELLDRNRQIIDELSEKLAGSEAKLGEFRRMYKRLKNQLAEKDAEIAGMKEELETMNYAVQTLGRRIDTLQRFNTNLSSSNQTQTARISEQDAWIAEQESKINSQTESLNTAYFIAGTAKELKSNNILTKDGGFIGIGSAKKLKTDFNEEAFTKVDITDFNKIPVDTKKAQILTTHPSGSYTFNEEGKKIESLEITDPEQFWKTSKYLVVVLN